MRDRSEDALIKENLGLRQQLEKYKQAEEALRKSEERYRLLADSVNDIIWMMDMNFHYTYLSPSIERQSGYTIEEAMTMTLEDNFTPASIEAIHKAFLEEIALESTQRKNKCRSRVLELEAYQKDGSTNWVEVVASLQRNAEGQPVGIMGVTRNISERKRVESERQRSEERYKLLFDNCGAGITVYGIDGCLLSVNDEEARNLGGNPGEFVGKSVYDLQPEQADTYLKRIHRVVMSGTAHGFEDMKQLPSGKRWFWSNLQPVRDENGKIYAVQIVTRDITERKQTEQKLQESLEREIEARRKLQEEMKKRVEFTRTLIHELKTPLTSVVASSGLLAAELPEGLLLKMAKNMNRSANDLSFRIDELLDVAKGELGMLKLTLTTVDLLALLQEVAEDVGPAALSRHQSLILDLPPVLPPVWGDENRLRQVVLNLFNNSCKFMGEGGKITLKAREEGDRLIVEVEDTGPGISEVECQHLFTAYYQGEGDKKHSSGLGLGLALCKTLVELHGGQIWVISKLGKGSIFGFSVPVATASQLKGKAESQRMMTVSKSGT
jgi:PAS domain S-box-containing protein